MPDYLTEDTILLLRNIAVNINWQMDFTQKTTHYPKLMCLAAFDLHVTFNFLFFYCPPYKILHVNLALLSKQNNEM